MLDQTTLELLEAHKLQLASIQFSRNTNRVHVAVIDGRGIRFKGWAEYYKTQTPVNLALLAALRDSVYQFEKHGTRTEVK